MIVIVCLLLSLACCAHDDASLKKHIDHYTYWHRFSSDRIDKEQMPDTQKTTTYLKVGRQLLLNMLAQKTQLQPYVYNAEKIQQGNASCVIKHAKIQVLPNNKYSFFWHCNADTQNFIHHQNAIQKISFLDAAFSPDGKYILSINSIGQIGLGENTQNGIVAFEKQFINQKLQNMHTEKKRITIKAAFITCPYVNDYCYYAVDNAIFRFNYANKNIRENKKIIKLEKGYQVSHISIFNDLITVTFFDKQGVSQTLSFLKNNDDRWYVTPTAQDKKYTVNLHNGPSTMMFNNQTITKDTIDTISDHYIATLRIPKNLSDCAAIDVSIPQNRIALLKTESRFKDKFAPKVLAAEFIPSYLVKPIQDFNTMVASTNPITKHQAQHLFKGILTAVEANKKNQSIWEWTQELIKNNMSLIGGIAAAGIAGMIWLFYKKNNTATSSIQPAAYGKIQQLTPGALRDR